MNILKTILFAGFCLFSSVVFAGQNPKEISINSPGGEITGPLFFDNDTELQFGTSQQVACEWSTSDANANELVCSGPENGATNVPFYIFGDATCNAKDIGLFDGLNIGVAVMDDACAKATYVTHNGTDGTIVTTSGDLLLNIQGANLAPSANDGSALGISGTAWADLFLASGGVINFNAGDVLITHSSNTLAFSGAATGYTFDGATTISPTISAAGAAGVTINQSANTAITTDNPAIKAATASETLNDGSTIAIGSWLNLAAPTYVGVAGGGTETVSDAATLYINAAPTQGANAVLTRPYSLFVDAGVERFDGDVYLNSGADLNIYSDVQTTLKATIDGATGEAILGTRVIGEAINCEVNYAAGTITISGKGGAALSATNPCHVGVRSNSNGVVVDAVFTANVTATDGAASQTDGNLFGITDANWASAMPIFFGIIYDGSTPYFTISRQPMLVSGGAAGNLCQLNDTDCDAETDVMILTTGLTLASWVNLPITQVAWLTATYATASSVWTFAETAYTGFNQLYQCVDFTYPQAQNGAAAGSHLKDNAGTAPIFTTDNVYYWIHPDRMVTVNADLQSDGGTDGSGAVTTILTLPFSAISTGGYVGSFRIDEVAETYVSVGVLSGGNPSMSFRRNADTAGALQSTFATVQNGNFTNGGRNILGTFEYSL